MTILDHVRPVFIFDDKCGFCRIWVERWRKLTQGAVEFHAAPDERFPQIPPLAYRRSSVFIDSDGQIYTGAQAVFRMLSHGQRQKYWLWAYLRVPGFALASEVFYRQIATHRLFFSRVQQFLSPRARN